MKYIKDVKVTVGQLRSLRSIWQRSVQTGMKRSDSDSANQKAGVFKLAKQVALDPQSNLWKGLCRNNLVINLMKRAVIRSLRLLPSAPAAAGCFSPRSKHKQSMNLKYEILVLAICVIEFCTCDQEISNNTSSSRREILEKQARNAYQNACFRLQELSNWMTVVFKIKSVWASSTVNEIASKSDGIILNESVRKIVPSLPSRPKAVSSECSLRSVQVTAQTYAYLQSQMILLKIIQGRNVLKSSKEKLDGVNVSIRERMKMLDIFNTTLNDILQKLKQNTEAASTSSVNSESWKAWNIIKDIQEGRFLQYLQDPAAFFRSAREQNVFDTEEARSSGSRNFFQSLGKTLDRIIFPTVSTAPPDLNLTIGDSEQNDGTPNLSSLGDA